MDIGASLGLTDTELPGIVVNIVNLFVGVSTFVTLIFLMIGALRWVTSGSSDDLRERAKKVMLRSLLGQVIVLLAWSIFLFVAKTISNAS